MALATILAPSPKVDESRERRRDTSHAGERPCPDCRWSLQSDFPEVPYAEGLEHCPDAWSMDLPMFEETGIVFCPVTGRYSLPMGRGPSKMIYFSGTFNDPTNGEPFPLGGYDPGAVQIASNSFASLLRARDLDQGAIFLDRDGNVHRFYGASLDATHDGDYRDAITVTGSDVRIQGDEGDVTKFTALAGIPGRAAETSTTQADTLVPPSTVTFGTYGEMLSLAIGGVTTSNGTWVADCEPSDGGTADAGGGDAGGGDAGDDGGGAGDAGGDGSDDGGDASDDGGDAGDDGGDGSDDGGSDASDGGATDGGTDGSTTSDGGITAFDGGVVCRPRYVPGTTSPIVVPQRVVAYGGITYTFIPPTNMIPPAPQYGGPRYRSAVPPPAVEGPALFAEKRREPDAPEFATNGNDTRMAWALSTGPNGTPAYRLSKLQETVDGNSVRLKFDYYKNGLVRRITYHDDKTSVTFAYAWPTTSEFWVRAEMVEGDKKSTRYVAFEAPVNLREHTRKVKELNASIGENDDQILDATRGILYANPATSGSLLDARLVSKVANDDEITEILYGPDRRPTAMKFPDGAELSVNYQQLPGGLRRVARLFTMGQPGGSQQTFSASGAPGVRDGMTTTTDTGRTLTTSVDRSDPSALKVTSGAGTITYSKDTKGLLSAVTPNDDSLQVSYGRDAEGRLRFITSREKDAFAQGGHREKTEEIRYDASGKVTYVADGEGNTMSLDYDDTGRVKLRTIRYASGETETTTSEYSDLDLTSTTTPATFAGSLDIHRTVATGKVVVTGESRDKCGRVREQFRGPSSADPGYEKTRETEWGTSCLPYLFECNKENYEARYPGRVYGSCASSPLAKYAWCDFVCSCAISCSCTAAGPDPFDPFRFVCYIWEDHWKKYTGPLGGCADETPPGSRCP